MKKLACIISVFCLCFLIMSCSDIIEGSFSSRHSKMATRAGISGPYYWYRGQQIPLNNVEGKKYILFSKSDASNVLQGVDILTYGENGTGPKNVTLSSNLEIKKQQNPLQWLIAEDDDALDKNDNVLYKGACFRTNNKEVFLGHLFYVKLRDINDFSKLKKVATENGVEIVGNNKYMPLWYTLACSKKSKGDALEMANTFYESDLFAACQPDLICEDELYGDVNDQYFSLQWGLNNTGQNGGTNGIDINFLKARDLTKGDKNIIVAVLDQGVNLSHPDINVYSKSYDTETGTSPSQVRGGHGTSCAGIISAKTNNNMGIAGIAPDCPVMSISNSLSGKPDSRQKRADGFNYAWRNGAAVISNSWGSGVKFQMLDDAISEALTKGRNGLGCVITFATGNDNSSVGYPANSNPKILAVGAISPCGERKSPSSCDGERWGSNYGDEIDVVAPGVKIPTTSNTGYTMTFNGTSSACPHVAGIAALVLSVNPSLTQSQVNDIIEQTAQKIGTYSYIQKIDRKNGTWNNEMGYGLCNAYAAVIAAKSNIVKFYDKNVSTNTTVSGQIILAQNVNVNSGANLQFNITNSVTITPVFYIAKGGVFKISK